MALTTVGGADGLKDFDALEGAAMMVSDESDSEI